MKVIACLTLAVSALAAPVLSFAQTTHDPITRAEVRAELTRLEQAGYNPSAGDDANYPADIQAAEAKVAAEQPAYVTNDAVGGMPLNGTSAVGAPVHPAAPHAPCVGPVSFCNIYFGS